MRRHLKGDVLRLLANGRGWSHEEIARDAGFWPIRSVSTYMRRLERQKLVRSARPWRRIVWFITSKGRARLRWFEAHPDYFRKRYLRGRAWATAQGAGAGQGQAPGPPTVVRGRRQGCRAARPERFLARDRSALGRGRRNGSQKGAETFQKPFAGCRGKRLRLVQ